MVETTALREKLFLASLEVVEKFIERCKSCIAAAGNARLERTFDSRMQILMVVHSKDDEIMEEKQVSSMEQLLKKYAESDRAEDGGITHGGSQHREKETWVWTSRSEGRRVSSPEGSQTATKIYGRSRRRWLIVSKTLWRG